MDGVRRWIGANQESAARKVSASVTGDTNTDLRKLEREDLDPTSMESVVSRLMAPLVSDVEKAEYEW